MNAIVKYKNYGLINSRLWLIMICQHRFIDCNVLICATLAGDTGDGGGYAYIGARSIWKLSVFSVPFCCEPKTVIKNKVYTVLRNGCISLHSHQQCKRFPFSLQSLQRLLFVNFLTMAILTSVRCYLVAVF